MSEEFGALSQPPQTPEPRRVGRRLRWIVIAAAAVAVVAVGVPLLIVGLRGMNDIQSTAQKLADALSDGDRKAFQSVLCQNVSPQPTWPDQLDRLHSIHVTVTGSEDPGSSSDVVPSATLVVDDTDIIFSVAINKYDKRISDQPCVFELDQATPVPGHQ